jgi:hypothetical protein
LLFLVASHRNQTYDGVMLYCHADLVALGGSMLLRDKLVNPLKGAHDF